MLEPHEYSKRLGVLTHEQLQAALDRFGLGRLIDAESAPGGLFGQIVLITTSSGRYALRGHPHAGQIQRERYVAELIATRTQVPVPWPYFIDESTAIFGWEYALMPRMPGVQLADGEERKRLTPDDRRGIVVAMAQCLAQLHEAPFEWSGAFDAAAGRFEPAAKNHADWFAVARRNGAWRVSGLFDLADAHLGDGEYDLARAYCEYIARPELAATYLRTYLKLRPPRAGFERRFRHYVLHDRLIIWEYAQRNQVWVRPGQALRSWAETYLSIPAL
jgi:hypothetical protein